MKDDKDKPTKDPGKLRGYSEVLSLERLSDNDVQIEGQTNPGGDIDKE
jgi:hypothetical protein